MGSSIESVSESLRLIGMRRKTSKKPPGDCVVCNFDRVVDG